MKTSEAVRIPTHLLDRYRAWARHERRPLSAQLALVLEAALNQAPSPSLTGEGGVVSEKGDAAEGVTTGTVE